MNLVEFLKQQRGFVPPLSDKYGEWLGYEIEHFDVSKKTLVTKLKIRQEHLSPSAAVHGGVVSGFLDFSCGCAVINLLKKDELCSTVDLNVKYFKPLKEGDEIIAKAKVVHHGKTLSSVVAHVFKKIKPEVEVAMASATFNIYKVSN
ncbi:MAG: hypothetical protein CME66_10255 [Halobacteriovoraceae bacterium]|nr:hypothetical protein [Halobacteriovoraceae bacterium]|tara:strand:+ start:561 stop:1001 length:441 start_codon:yes stop_codon:yes gene_type:complete